MSPGSPVITTHDETEEAGRVYCGGMSCAAEASLTANLLAGRWAPRILECLHFAGAPVRFKELQRRVEGISQKELSRQLLAFAEYGVVDRVVQMVKPLQVEYSLTPAGKKLIGHIAALAEWQQQR